MPTRDENVPIGEEHPDPHTPPTPTAPGSAGLRKSPEPGQGQFQEAYDETGEAQEQIGTEHRPSTD
jgi:hypothetical protein